MFTLIFISLLIGSQVSAQAPEAKQDEKAKKSLELFLSGVRTFDEKKYGESIALLTESLAHNSAKSAYVYFLLGRAYRELGELEKSRTQFEKVRAVRAVPGLQYESRFQLGDLALQARKPKEALAQLGYLERKWRRTYRHPDVLYRMVRAKVMLGQKNQACGWARKLYAQYPSHASVKSWAINLNANTVDGVALGCRPTSADLRSRLRRLQWAGEAQKAHAELAQLTGLVQKDSTFEVDLLKAQFLTFDGYAEEALKVLLKHYETHKRHPGYLMALGQAAARGGEYTTAVGAFTQAHHLSPRTRFGRQALFQAAFLSYQTQDYDGAARKFEDFRRQHGRSGLSRDAEWHLAWIRYLKGDYQGALEKFGSMVKEAGRRRSGGSTTERARYWLAMSHLRLEQFDQAKEELLRLMANRSYSYYALAAQNRYNSLPGVRPVQQLSSLDAAQLKALLKSPVVDGTESDGSGVVAAANDEEAESEESLVTTEDAGSDAMAESEPEEPAEDVQEQEKDVAIAADFSVGRWTERFQVANELIQAQLLDWAQWELHEIERRTRSQEHLKILLKAYEKTQHYHRSAFIAETHFAHLQRQLGLVDGRSWWEAAFPRAYSRAVEDQSRQFGVPSEFIWAIMKAESAFRPEVISPVGARGLMQLMPNTALQVGRLLNQAEVREDDLTNPELNIRLGSRYLHRLLKKFDSQVPLAAAAYNAGPHRVEAWLASFGRQDMDEFIEHIPFVETRNYVKKVVRHYAIYKELYAKEPRPLGWLSEPILAQIPSKPASREDWDQAE